MVPKNIQRWNWQTSGVGLMKEGRALICAIMMLLVLVTVFLSKSYAGENVNRWKSKKVSNDYCAVHQNIGQQNLSILVYQDDIRLMKFKKWEGSLEIIIDNSAIPLSVDDIYLFGGSDLLITFKSGRRCVQAFKNGTQLIISTGNKDEIFVIGLAGFNSAYKRAMKGQVDPD
jgi:hypothetical protein